MAAETRPPATGVGAYEAHDVAATYRTARALGSETLRMRIAANLAEYAARVRSRSFSSMQALPDDAWQQRLAEFEEYCRTAPDGPVDEPVNLFVFGGPDMAPQPPDVRGTPA